MRILVILQDKISKSRAALIFSILCLLTGCHPCCVQDHYRTQYAHLEARDATLKQQASIPENEYSLTLLVDAKHLDYSNGDRLLSTIAKHPNGSRRRDVGHAWLVLSGVIDGKRMRLEGGHSGERAISEPRYLDSILLNQSEPNPVRILFTTRSDGYFESGSGGHKPTYAISIAITKEKFLTLYNWMTVPQYPFTQYSFTENQCTTFVVKAASIAGLTLASEAVVSIPPYVYLGGRRIRLWEDPCYSTITLHTPDLLEKSMIEAVLAGKAQVALDKA